MKRLLLDLNVFLDVILDRPPDADVAAALWAAIERGQDMVPAHGVTTIFAAASLPQMNMLGLPPANFGLTILALPTELKALTKCASARAA